MKKAFTYFLSFSIAALVLVLTTSQVKAPATTAPEKATDSIPTKLTDSTFILSIRDINAFNVWLKGAATFDQYTKLSPEATLVELVAWKKRQIEADATKNK